jgi:hypothetical protein
MPLRSARQPHAPATPRKESESIWQWTEALATARPGARYRVARIPFSLARARCAQLGCSEGQVFTCRANAGGTLVLEGPEGRRVILERELAWFIQAEVHSPGGSQPH